MDRDIEGLIALWQKRNICGVYCNTQQDAREKILEFIPSEASIGFSGSVTLTQLGIIKQLETRGHKIYDPYKPGLSRDESLKVRKSGAQADYYLASPNAISQKGELVFLSAYNNRIVGISSASKVLIVSGINKITADLETAIKRAREVAAPLNSKRLNWNSPCFKDGICHNEICNFPEYKRMCCQLLIIEAEIVPDRLTVVLVGEDLGY